MGLIKNDTRRILYYDLHELLGSGGMGQVWMAVDSRLARPVALKMLPPSLAGDEEARARFHREVMAASALNHPNIVTIFETGEFKGQLLIAMELIRGVTLKQLIGGPPVSKEKVYDLFRQSLSGLMAAHRARLIHRDIKPDNIMVRDDGFVKILDFGLAKKLDGDVSENLTMGIVGTPRYMSPEQATGRKLDQSTDLFSLGAVFYEVITRKPAFVGENLHQVLSAVISQEPPAAPDNDDCGLWPIISRMLQKDRAKRYSDAAQVINDLDNLSGSGSPLPVELAKDREPVEKQMEKEESLVVIPFTCSGEDRELSTGVADGIIDGLSRVKGVRVMSRSASFRFVDEVPSPEDLARQLNVTLALMGTIRRANSRVRVSVELVNLADGFSLWSHRFRFEIKDIFEAEDQIADQVAESLSEHFGNVSHNADTDKARVRSRTDDTSARDAYLKGIYHLSSYRQDDLEKAVTFFEAAIEQDPGFVDARARYAETLMSLAYVDRHSPGAQQLSEEAAIQARTALEMDPENPWANVAMAVLDFALHDPVSAKNRLERILENHPNHVGALVWISMIYTLLGRPSQGEAAARRAVERDPADANNHSMAAYALLSRGRYVQAMESLDRAVRLDPRNPMPYCLLLFANMAVDRREEASMLYTFMGKFVDKMPVARMLMMIYQEKYSVEGPCHYTDEEIFSLEDTDECWIGADLFALRGEDDKVFAMLNRAVDLRNLNIALLESDPFLAPYRGGDGYEKIKTRMEDLVAMAGGSR